MTQENENKPASLQQLLGTMTPEIHEQLKSAIALGRWENGEKLTPEQRENCLQAVIAYDQAFVVPEQRVAHLNRDIGPRGAVQQDTGKDIDG